jgi:hypothetical protein
MFTLLALIDFFVGITLVGQYWFKSFDLITLGIIFLLHFSKSIYFLIKKEKDKNKKILNLADLVISIFIFIIFFIHDISIFFWIPFFYLVYRVILRFWLI